MRLLVWLPIAMAVLAAAQSEPGPSSKPNLLRTRIYSDPLTILGQLQSSLPADRRAGFLSLGFTADDDDVGFSPVARLLFENLDEDDDLEAVLGFERMGTAIVVVLDKSEGVWWKAGQFTSGSRESGNLGRTMDMQSLIEDGRSELIIRDSDGGTDIAETHVSIYRLEGGHLRRVFRVTAEAKYRVVGAQGAGTATYERAWLYYPDRKIAGAPIIVVSRAKAVIGSTPDLELDRKLRIAPSACEVYCWNTVRREFVVDDSRASIFCGDGAVKAKGGRRAAKP